MFCKKDSRAISDNCKSLKQSTCVSSESAAQLAYQGPLDIFIPTAAEFTY